MRTSPVGWWHTWPKQAAARIVCVSAAVTALGMAAVTFVDVSLMGFPDGHVTEYQQAVDAPLTVLAWLAAGAGAVLLMLAWSPVGTRARAMLFAAALVLVVLVGLAVQVEVPWYFGTHLGLDNGVGG